MKKLLLVAKLLFAALLITNSIGINFITTSAMAQQPQPKQAEIDFKLTTDDVNGIGEALGKMPYEKAAPILQKLRDQYLSQQAKAASQPEEKKDNKK